MVQKKEQYVEVVIGMLMVIVMMITTMKDAIGMEVIVVVLKCKQLTALFVNV